VTLSHLSEPERQLAVSRILAALVRWFRGQPGSERLRVLVYIDEVAGYAPPTAEPATKKPILTILKQARAFGVGMVLATQNPVDLDYKGLSNAGTWFIGRLQTDRDKQRLLDGLEGAAAGQSARFDRAAMEQTLAGLGSRVFLMNNVHEDAPVVFESRWAMSYLRGPLTRGQIKTLMDPLKSAAADAQPTTSAPEVGPAARSVAAASPASQSRPVFGPEITQRFIPIRSSPPPDGKLIYQPALLGCGTVYFTESRTGIDHEEALCLLAPLKDAVVAVEWEQAGEVGLSRCRLHHRDQGR
jgi:hypothetical protein